MVALQKADTNLDEVVNDVNNLVNCTHCHGQKKEVHNHGESAAAARVPGGQWSVSAPRSHRHPAECSHQRPSGNAMFTPVQRVLCSRP